MINIAQQGEAIESVSNRVVPEAEESVTTAELRKVKKRTSNQTDTRKTNLCCRFPCCKQRRSIHCELDETKTSTEDQISDLCPGHRKKAESVSSKVGNEVEEPVQTVRRKIQKEFRETTRTTIQTVTLIKTVEEEDTASMRRSFVNEFQDVFQGIGLEPKAKRVIEVEEPVPTVNKSHEKPSTAKKISLRTADQTRTSENVELKQFDPNFFSHANVWCRYSGCKHRKTRECTSTSKEDLYLCPSHRKNLEDDIAKMCAQKSVETSKSWSSEALKEYTSLIGQLERCYCSLAPSVSKHTAILKEVFLNMRNYLVIVNALLNPQEENLITSLTSPLLIFKQIQQFLQSDDSAATLKTLKELIDLLRQVIEYILSYFGIFYSWVYLSLVGKSAAQVGVGIGGFIGMLGFGAGPAVGAMTTAGGAFFGGLIGNGLYNLLGMKREGKVNTERPHHIRIQANFRAQCDAATAGNLEQEMQQQPSEDECVVYYLTGSVQGDLFLECSF